MKSSGAYRHRGKMSSEVIVLTKAKREHLETPSSKRRLRKRRNRTAQRCTGISIINKAPPKRMNTCRLIGKTKKKEGPRRRTSTHFEITSRQVRLSKTRGTIPRPFHVKSARGRPFRYPGQTMIHKSRLPWRDSTEHKSRRRYKHRWKEKHGQPLTWCG